MMRNLGFTVAVGASALAVPCHGQVTTINSLNPVANGGFGLSVAATPDVNGDTRADILVGAPTEGPNAAGRVYLLLGSVGVVLRTFSAPTPKVGSRFGAAVAGVPDANGDGLAEIAIGAPGLAFGTTPPGSGVVYLYNGFNGNFLRTMRAPVLEANANFGYSLAGIADLNADGAGDIIIGVPFENPGVAPFNCGRVYVYSGKTGRVLRTLASPIEQSTGKFGTSVASVPDLNADGKADIIVGSQEVSGEGRVHVYSGATGAFIRTLVSPAAEPGGLFGWSVGGIPDVNNDQRGDIVVGAPGEDPGVNSPTNCGRAYVFSGATGDLLWTLISLSSEVEGRFGWSVAGMPDTNGDLRGDVVIGAPGEDPLSSPTDAGRVYVHSGATGARLATLFSFSEAAGGRFGSAVAGLPDVNLNNRSEVVAGAPGELLGGVTSGRAFLIRR